MFDGYQERITGQKGLLSARKTESMELKISNQNKVLGIWKVIESDQKVEKEVFSFWTSFYTGPVLFPYQARLDVLVSPGWQRNATRCNISLFLSFQNDSLYGVIDQEVAVTLDQMN